MSNELDNNLTKLFSESYEELPHNPFLDKVTTVIETKRRQSKLVKIILAALCLTLLSLFSQTINTLVLGIENAIKQPFLNNNAPWLINIKMDSGGSSAESFMQLSLSLPSFITILIGIIATLSWIAIFHLENTRRSV